ncbi:MAG: 3-hydroxyisobutyrate dehydrogenase-like beta-hydroxyacid dehydrogenase [Paracoccaceae bacterium]|jgi:3-hydroxyisobutyrate dehydrogenase-like beta-hydroxyacid dehydrogenase
MIAERLGPIGFGGMGRGLAKNLLAHGAELRVADPAPALVDAGAAPRAVAAEVGAMAEAIDIRAICITKGEAKRALCLGPDGALARMQHGSAPLDHATVSPDHLDIIRAACTALG